VTRVQRRIRLQSGHRPAYPCLRPVGCKLSEPWTPQMIARKCKHIRPMARVRRSVRGGTRSDTTNRHDRPGADCGQGTRPPGYRGEVVSSPTRTSRASASLSVPQPVHSPDPRLTSLAVTTRPFCRANSRGAGHWGSSRLGGSYPFELGPASPAARLEKDHEPTGDWHRVERH